jgi:hypothetical protein
MDIRLQRHMPADARAARSFGQVLVRSRSTLAMIFLYDFPGYAALRLTQATFFFLSACQESGEDCRRRWRRSAYRALVMHGSIEPFHRIESLHVLEDCAVEIGFGKIGASQIGAGKVRAREVDAKQVRARQVRAT